MTKAGPLMLLLTTQRLDALSGVNTYLQEFRSEAIRQGRRVEILSSATASKHQLLFAISRADIVHLNTADPIAFLLAKLLRKPVLQRYHYTFWGTTHKEDFKARGFLSRLLAEVVLRWSQTGFRQPQGWIWFCEQMVRLSFRILVGFGADRVVTCSHMLTKALELPRDCFTIYYPYQLTALPRSISRERFLFFAGRIDEAKGLENVIRALEQLRLDKVVVPLQIAGEGPDRARLTALAVQLGVVDLLHWHGRLGSEGVTSLMRRAHAVVVPSISNDPSPFVVLEAAQGDTPVIGSMRGGIPEEIGEGGWLVDPSSVKSIMTAIKDAWNSPAECGIRGAKLRRHVEDRFNPAKAVAATFALMSSPPAGVKAGAIHHVGTWWRSKDESVF